MSILIDLVDETKILSAHTEWLRTNLFSGPRWLTLPKGYKWKKAEKTPIPVSYLLTWQGNISTVWADIEIDVLGELHSCGRNSQLAHDNLIAMLVGPGFNQAYIPFYKETSQCQG